MLAPSLPRDKRGPFRIGSRSGRSPGRDNQLMSRRGRRVRGTGALEAYRRLRSPMPPPERVITDRRRKLADAAARREMEEGESERGRSSGGT